jgi:hypothetical protein
LTATANGGEDVTATSNGNGFCHRGHRDHREQQGNGEKLVTARANGNGGEDVTTTTRGNDYLIEYRAVVSNVV